MLTDEDREVLRSAVIHVDGAPVALDLKIVEQIVARHVAAALNDAADAIEPHAHCSCEVCETKFVAATTIRDRIPT